MRQKQKGRTQKKRRVRHFPEPCKPEMNFHECELAILRQAIDTIEVNTKQVSAQSPEVKKMITIVESFLKETKCICYGGTAINNILPPEVQFYDRDIEIPDYDFYSRTPVEHARQLADTFYKMGYADVEAKAGVHFGTYKVFVNFIPMADITLLHEELYENISRESIEIDGIQYAPANFLRMNMFLELSRPNGDVSRWEKVLKRLTLLNAHYPLSAKGCESIDFQRSMDTKSEEDGSEIYFIVRDVFIEQKVIFFGGYASALYSEYMPEKQQQIVKSIPDFDVLCENAKLCANILIERLKEEGHPNSKIVKHEAVGEIVPVHYEIMVGEDTLALIYEPIACHNYNEIEVEHKKIRVATIDTILSFYLAILFTDQGQHHKDRLMCMSKFLFEVEQHNLLSQKGLLKRFSLRCYGDQPTLESIRSEKADMFRKLKKKRNSAEWDSWFLKYTPGENSAKNKKTLVDATKTKTKSKTKTKNNIDPSNIDPSIQGTNFWEDSETPQSQKSASTTIEPSDTKRSTTRSAMRTPDTTASRKSKKNLSFSENVDEYLF